MIPRFLQNIWHIRGSLPLAPALSHEEAFARLDPLFRQTGTSHERNHDTLVFSKKDQAAQDKMAVFDHGELRIEDGAGGPVLRYHLISRVLLFCFLSPLMFLAIAQGTIALGKYEAAREKAKAEKKKDDKKDEDKVLPQHWFDKAMGAPAPEKPKKDDKKKDEEKDKGPSPTPAYVFAGIFAFLYLIGRILEDRLVKSLFRKKLAEA